MDTVRVRLVIIGLGSRECCDPSHSGLVDNEFAMDV